MSLLIHVTRFLYVICIYPVHMLNHVNTMPGCTEKEVSPVHLFCFDLYRLFTKFGMSGIY